MAVLNDGTPMTLTVPHLFIECLQSGEDYYSRYYSALPGRLLRLLALVVTTTLPALYVALETFHPEMIPTVLMITMAATKEGIPDPERTSAPFVRGRLIVFEKAGE